MKETRHEGIEAHLTRIGVTDEAAVSAAIDAHEVGVDVEAIIRDVTAGVPDWLALLKALHLADLLRAHKPAPKAARARKPTE